MSADLIARLVAAGTPAELVGEVAMALASAQAESNALATRRARDAARQQDRRERERESRDITLCPVTSCDVTDEPPLDKKAPHTPKELIPLTPDNADALSPPAGADGEATDAKKPKRARSAKTAGERGSRLPDDWQPCPVAELSDRVQALVRQWPGGAYEHVGEMFRNHFLAEGRAIGSKRDWPRTWSNWLMREHAAILRQARQGVQFLPPPRPVAAGADPAFAPEAIEAFAALKAAEGERAAQLRDRLRRRMGARVYGQWMEICAFGLEGGRLVVTAHSEFARGWIEANHRGCISEEAAELIGRPIEVSVRVVKPPDGTKGDSREAA